MNIQELREWLQKEMDRFGDPQDRGSSWNAGTEWEAGCSTGRYDILEELFELIEE